MSDSSGEDCCSDSVLSPYDEVVDTKLAFVILLTVIFVRLFDHISDYLRYNINCFSIMGNLFSRLTGNCNNPEDEDKRSHRSALKPDTNAGTQQTANVPEIRKHSSTPITETTPKLQFKSDDKPVVDTNVTQKAKKRQAPTQPQDKTVFTTTFETQVDAAPPHPLEEKLKEDLEHNLIEIDTNLFTPEVEDAVVKIQAGVRGYLARKHVNRMKSETEDCEVFSEDTPVVPPPKNFDNSELSPLGDLDQWKKLSQHLEDKAIDVIDHPSTDGQSVGRKINGSLTEEIIPLKDSNNKVIETYVCKENILDVETPTEETTVQKKRDQEVVDKVFNVLMSETESEDIMNFVEKGKEKIEGPVVPQESEDSQQSPESEVLAKLNETLDTYDTNVEPIVEKPVTDEPKPTVETAVTEMVSQTQQIIKDSFQQFVKQMTKSDAQELTREETTPAPEESLPIVQSEEIAVETVSEPPKPEEKKTDSMIFEEAVVESAFSEELAKNPSQSQIVAIEVFKQDVTEEQLANVTTLDTPEPEARNMWGVEERSFKTSVDQFVVKPVETPAPVQPVEPIPEPEVVETGLPVLDREQVIEIISESRKNSEDLLESEVVHNDGNQLIPDTEEVVPPASPIIQIEEQNGNILDEEEAAIRIQAAFRGYQIRRSMSREASPNRSASPNHNNIDNNNNSFNDSIDVTAETLSPSQLQVSNEPLLLPPEESQIITQESVENKPQQDMSGSNEQINTSLEKLEDQLINELMSSAEEESRNEAIVNDKLDTAQKLLEEMDSNSGELTAPLLLQRLQQSFSGPPVSHPEEQVPTQEVIESTEESDVERPLIEKSDTIIVDLMASQPIVFTNDETQSPLIQSNEDFILDDIIRGSNVVTEEELISQSLVIDQPNQEIIAQEPIHQSEPQTEPLIQSSTQIPQEISCDVSQDVVKTEELIPEPQEVVIMPSAVEPTEAPEVINTELIDNIQSIDTQSPQTAEISSEESLVSQQTEQLQEVETPKPSESESVVPLESQPVTEHQIATESFEQVVNEILADRQSPEPEPESPISDRGIERHRSVTFSDPENEVIVYSKENSVELDDKVIADNEPVFQSLIEPPTPDVDNVTQITPEVSFVNPSEEAELTKITSSESEQEPEVISNGAAAENPSPLPEPTATTNGEQTKLKPILKETINTDEPLTSNTESISSPDDDNPEFVGLGPNTGPIPVRASSPNPFGKKRRRGKKGGQRK